MPFSNPQCLPPAQSPSTAHSSSPDWQANPSSGTPASLCNLGRSNLDRIRRRVCTTPARIDLPGRRKRRSDPPRTRNRRRSRSRKIAHSGRSPRRPWCNTHEVLGNPCPRCSCPHSRHWVQRPPQWGAVTTMGTLPSPPGACGHWRIWRIHRRPRCRRGTGTDSRVLRRHRPPSRPHSQCLPRPWLSRPLRWSPERSRPSRWSLSNLPQPPRPRLHRQQAPRSRHLRTRWGRRPMQPATTW